MRSSCAISRRKRLICWLVTSMPPCFRLIWRLTRSGSIDPCQLKRRALDLSGDAINSPKILFSSTPDSQQAANFGICDDPDYFTLKRSLTMITYVAIIGRKAALTFRAVDDDQAHAMIDDQEGSVQSDLKVLVDMDGKPLWDGKSAIQVREATAEPNGDGLATKQLSTGKLTWMLATIQMSGASTYLALPERTKFSAKTRNRRRFCAVS